MCPTRTAMTNGYDVSDQGGGDKGYEDSTFPPYIAKIHSNIILPSMPRCS